MNPLPAGTQPTPSADELQPSPFASALPSSAQAKFPHPTQRRQHPAPLLYPLLLLASTTLAAAFCYLYISKPVILAPAPPANSVSRQPTVQITPPAAVSPPQVAARATPTAGLVPNADQLPGDGHAAATERQSAPGNSHHAMPNVASGSALEETNLRIQHILTAETPGGDMSRIVLDVPVLYQTGTLAWTQAEVAEARELLKRLDDYQDQSRSLRAEGTRLLAEWNRLVERTTPTPVLRADSPALPTNQRAGEGQPQPATLDTSESIQLQPTGP
jgi:hypothetical protein